MEKIWDFSQYKNNTAIIDEFGNEISYDKLRTEASLLAEFIGKRCLVFSLCKNEVGAVIGYVSFISHGIVPLLLNSSLDRSLLDNLIQTYKPEFLLVPSDLSGDFWGLESVYEIWGYSLLKTGYVDAFPLNDELGLLMTTSGSTGSPQLVRQSYANLYENAYSIADYLELNMSERPITTLPMNYVYGLSIINSHFLVGATLLLTDKGIMQREFWRFLNDAEATSFGGVPYTYEMLDRISFYRMNLPSLKTMTQAGGKLSLELQFKLAKYAQKTGKRFVIMYGATEATSRMGYLPPEKNTEKKGSIGIPIPGGKFYLIDEEGNTINKPYTTGELVYEGKNVALGYAQKGEDLNLGDERKGKLKTGDMAQFDEDGYYYIVGRKSRILKLYGNRMNLDEIEQMIKTEYRIEVAVSGVDDHLRIYLTDEEQIDGVRKFIESKIRLNHSAFSVILADSIPKNESGKILYKNLDKGVIYDD